MNNHHRYAFITRIKNKNDLLNPGLISLVKASHSAGIKDIFIISNFSAERLQVGGITVTVVKSTNPISPNALNVAIRKINSLPNIDGFLICSKEVDINKRNIDTLISKLQNDKNNLVIGFKFKIKNTKLNTILKAKYNSKALAFIIPWNTCALWNYSHFKKYVGQFSSPKGMEEGIAMAKGLSSQKRLRYILLKTQLNWNVSKNRVVDHEKKIERKEQVLLSALKKFNKQKK